MISYLSFYLKKNTLSALAYISVLLDTLLMLDLTLQESFLLLDRCQVKRLEEDSWHDGLMSFSKMMKHWFEPVCLSVNRILYSVVIDFLHLSVFSHSYFQLTVVQAYIHTKWGYTQVHHEQLCYIFRYTPGAGTDCCKALIYNCWVSILLYLYWINVVKQDIHLHIALSLLKFSVVYSLCGYFPKHYNPLWT